MKPSTATASPSQPQVIKETTVVRKGGFFPMALGGLAAGCIGFGAAAYFPELRNSLPFLPGGSGGFEEEARSALEEQSGQIATLSEAVQTTSSTVETLQGELGAIDLAPVQGAVDTLEADLQTTRSEAGALAESVAAFESRVSAIEKQPLAEAVSPEAIAAYERELEQLRAAVASQTEEVQGATTQATQTVQEEIEKLRAVVAEQQAALEALASEAKAAEASAAQKAVLAESRATIGAITSKLNSGEAFAEELATLETSGLAVPEALSAVAADGAPTLGALVGAFPAQARSALQAVRSSGEDAEAGGGVAGFLQGALGARSTRPREGNDADAVLSRAEAAVRNSDLETALTEISALPEGAQSVLSDWVTQATTRRDALSALSELTQSLNAE